MTRQQAEKHHREGTPIAYYVLGKPHRGIITEIHESELPFVWIRPDGGGRMHAIITHLDPWGKHAD